MYNYYIWSKETSIQNLAVSQRQMHRAQTVHTSSSYIRTKQLHQEWTQSSVWLFCSGYALGYARVPTSPSIRPFVLEMWTKDPQSAQRLQCVPCTRRLDRHCGVCTSVDSGEPKINPLLCWVQQRWTLHSHGFTVQRLIHSRKHGHSNGPKKPRLQKGFRSPRWNCCTQPTNQPTNQGTPSLHLGINLFNNNKIDARLQTKKRKQLK